MKPEDPSVFYESLFDNMLDGLAYCQMIFDMQGNLIDWIHLRVNKNYENLTGLKNVTGKKISEIIPGIRASNPELFEIYGRLYLTGKSKRFEIYVKPLSMWFLVSAYSPQKGFFVAVLQNITDRKQIEEDLENARTAAKNVFEDLQVEKEALDNTKAKDEAILSGIGEGLVAVDKEGNILFISKAFEALTGWGEKEIAGKRMVEVVPQEDEAGNLVPPQERAITQALVGTTTTSSSSSSWYYIRKDKTRFPASGIVTPVTLDGKIIGAVEVFRDITKEKEIDRMKTEFLALASHQLRTPLSGIKWFVETLDRKILGTVNQKQQEYLDQIYQLNERALKIVFDMLNALRIEGGDVAMKTEAISLARLARDVSLATAPVAEQRGVRLHADVKNLATTVVETDAEMLRSILETFIVNAINYSERGQDIFFDVTEETGSVVFSVKDSGIGIPNDEQGRIFEKFYRASNAKKFKPDGTGLGLYVASMLAEKIGAKILLESEPGKGSIFYLRVPKLKSTT